MVSDTAVPFDSSAHGTAGQYLSVSRQFLDSHHVTITTDFDIAPNDFFLAIDFKQSSSVLIFGWYAVDATNYITIRQAVYATDHTRLYPVRHFLDTKIPDNLSRFVEFGHSVNMSQYRIAVGQANGRKYSV